MSTNKFSIAAIALVASTGLVHAASARAVALDEKVVKADAIVVGECIAQQMTTDPSGRWILTKSTFRVRHSYKGALANEIELVTPGGSVNGIHQETIGVPRFAKGDVNLLFVSQQNPVGPTVLFFDQGTYSVSGARGREVVEPVASQLVLVDTQTGKALSVDRRPRSLQEFEREIRSILERKGLSETVTMNAAGVEQKKLPDWRRDLRAFVDENSVALILLGIGATIAALAAAKKILG